MDGLYLFNGIIYFVSVVIVIVAIYRLPRGYRWAWVVAIPLFLFVALVYLGVFVGIMDEVAIINYVRPVSSLMPLQTVVLTWLIVYLLGERDG